MTKIKNMKNKIYDSNKQDKYRIEFTSPYFFEEIFFESSTDIDIIHKVLRVTKALCCHTTVPQIDCSTSQQVYRALLWRILEPTVTKKKMIHAAIPPILKTYGVMFALNVPCVSCKRFVKLFIFACFSISR